MPEVSPTPQPTATATPVQEPTPQSEILEYRVQPGDALISIAERFGVTTEAIAELNDLQDLDRLQIGQVLRIPGQEGP